MMMLWNHMYGDFPQTESMIIINLYNIYLHSTIMNVFFDEVQRQLSFFGILCYLTCIHMNTHNMFC